MWPQLLENQSLSLFPYLLVRLRELLFLHNGHLATRVWLYHLYRLGHSDHCHSREGGRASRVAQMFWVDSRFACHFAHELRAGISGWRLHSFSNDVADLSVNHTD